MRPDAPTWDRYRIQQPINRDDRRLTGCHIPVSFARKGSDDKVTEKDACGELSPKKEVNGVTRGPYLCTLEEGHDGQHVATRYPNSEVIIRWGDDDE